MYKIKKHVVLPNGLHVLQIYNTFNKIIKIEIFTEEEYQHFDWWNKVLIKFNLTTI